MLKEKGNIVKMLQQAEVIIFFTLSVTTLAFSASQKSSID